MTISVGLGLADFPFSDARAFWRWVELCESGGVDSLWQTDRLVSRQPILECMSVKAALAGATKRLKFGRNIRAPDWQATGRDTKGRGARTNEGLELIARLWVEDSVDFEGAFYRYRGASISPKPVQKDLPLWLGGSSQAAIRRTARFGTGWQAGFETPEEAGPVIEAIKAALVEEGRRIEPDHYGAGFAYRYGTWDDEPVSRTATAYRARSGRDPRRAIVAGNTDAIMRRIAEYTAVGVSKFILRPIGADDADMLAQTRRLIDETLPAVAALNGSG